MIRNIIFDLDGTLINTLEDLRDSVNHVLSLHGYPERSLDEVRRFVGNGIPKLCERAAPDDISAQELAGIVREMKEWYPAHSEICTRPYDGIPELLKKLSGMDVRMAVVTNKTESAAKRLCADMFGGVFTAVIGENGGPLKPDPYPVRRAMQAMGAIQEQTVCVGDSEVDVRTAKNSGLTAVGVLWGFRDRRTLVTAGADVIISAPEELLTIL